MTGNGIYLYISLSIVEKNKNRGMSEQLHLKQAMGIVSSFFIFPSLIVILVCDMFVICFICTLKTLYNGGLSIKSIS